MTQLTPAGTAALDEELDLGELGPLGELEPTSPPLIGEDGRVRLSFTRVDTYARCPLQFRFAYVDRLPSAPGPALSFGSSIHTALERFYDRKLPECPSEDELLGFLYEAWETTGFDDVARDEQVRWYRHAQDVLRRYHRRVAGAYRLPASVEAWFELPVGDDALVVGAIDRVDVDDDQQLHVVDYKTNRRIKDRDRVARSLQLAIYALACEHLYGRLPATVQLDFVVPGVEIVVPLEQLDLDAARAAVLRTAAGVQAEAYEPQPNRLCGWCDYRALCPAWEGDGPEVLGPAVLELESRRRALRRDVRAMRELEAGVERARSLVALPDTPRPGADPQDPVPAPDQVPVEPR